MNKAACLLRSPTSSPCSRADSADSDDKAHTISEHTALRCLVSVRWLSAWAEASLGVIKGICY